MEQRQLQQFEMECPEEAKNLKELVEKTVKNLVEKTIEDYFKGRKEKEFSYIR